MAERVVDVLAKESARGLSIMLCRDNCFEMMPNLIPNQLLYEEVDFWKVYGNKVVIELKSKENKNV